MTMMLQCPHYADQKAEAYGVCVKESVLDVGRNGDQTRRQKEAGDKKKAELLKKQQNGASIRAKPALSWGSARTGQ